MHLYRHLTPSMVAAPPRALGQNTPTIGEIVDGTQQLKADVASNVLTFLQARYFLLDPTNSGVAGSVGYAAVTPEGVKQAGAQLEGLQTAAQQLGELSAQYIALANVTDTMKVLQAMPPAMYRLVVVDSRDAAKTIAQPGSDWAVLQPRGAGGAMTKPSTATTTGGLSSSTLIGAAAGLIVGGLIAGPVGAVVGALAVGALVNATQK